MPESKSDPAANRPESEGTEALLGWQDVPQFADELHLMAEQLLRREGRMHSLQPTLLVNTALRRQRRSGEPWEEVSWKNRKHFFGSVYRAMRRGLVDYGRHMQTDVYRRQRPSVREFEDYESWRTWTTDPALAWALETGLRELRDSSPDLARVVEHRFFAGMTWPDVAEEMELAESTVRRYWDQARVMMEVSIRKHWASLEENAAAGAQLRMEHREEGDDS